ncbi:endonuclease/exonuclease/phosphatase family protein [Microbacterium sp. RURRCA19A]|uniref:endonuclease/exonuclease/phosphatase family protein n=1 Tax=Microbacterium sp. RURRCA19A TaxID=1907391 RepID=UPI0011158A6D|nr:endonuclease/exonuclease/phosphatase family protein [Microbacterium sp. RURRCA19A]
MSITIATVNVASPSLARAHQLVAWFPSIDADMVILTEISSGSGTAAIVNWFHQQGWRSLVGKCTQRERATAIFSRFDAVPSPLRPQEDYLPGRCLIAEVSGAEASILVVGMYLPTRGNDPMKLERKFTYMKIWGETLRELSVSHPVLLLGDLNIVPHGQNPKGFPQLASEYDWLTRLEQARFRDMSVLTGQPPQSTWISPSGEGYTFDHGWASDRLISMVEDFEYLHESRTSGITDHSAIRVQVRLGVNFIAPKLRPMPLFPEQQSLF